MAVIDFLRDWLGVSSGNDDIFIIFACVFGLIIFDNLCRALLGIISSLFRRK